jgi:hypothetical protein
VTNKRSLRWRHSNKTKALRPKKAWETCAKLCWVRTDPVPPEQYQPGNRNWLILIDLLPCSSTFVDRLSTACAKVETIRIQWFGVNNTEGGRE